MLRAVEYREVNLNNPFRKQTIYRGVPTPEGDKAWNKLWLRMLHNYTMFQTSIEGKAAGTP